MAQKQVLVLNLICLGSLFLKTVPASTEYNKYVAQIFQKYGNGGTINFEVITNKPSN